MLKIRIILHLLKENGLRWFILYLGERFTGWIFFQRRRFELETANNLSGFNTTVYNLKEWGDYNWLKGGEEWTESLAWKDALVHEVLLPFLKKGQTVLEIGPGGGRWSEILAQHVRILILVDLTEKALAVCKARLTRYTHIQYHLTSGSDLSFVPNNSIDLLWSFDVFVHVSPTDTKNYLKSIAKVLKLSGVAIIHHPAEGGRLGGFRSSVTTLFFNNTLRDCNLRIIQQFDSWGNNDVFSVRRYKDTITIFARQL